MILNFKVFYPGGNTTALLEQPIKAVQRAGIAKKIMTKNPEIEQVGFVSFVKNKLRLDMMGNELCVNGAQCAALNWHLGGRGNNLLFKIPGLKNQILAKIKNGTVRLWFPKAIVLSTRLTPDGYLVSMPGMRYLISSHHPNNLALIKHQLKKYADKVPAIGFIYLKSNADKISINPWIWVKATNTFIHETACGSGSMAAAFVHRLKHPKRQRYQIKQPSGKIYQVQFEPKNITIEAEVKYLGTKQVNMTDV